ncbi:MAG TPA: cytochrome bd-I ubiquinol oxidase subunit CydA, partial [Paracoccus sp.]|nr:cytochrome bd-I ubiquinol oxidase subunit CydA [Paracoccus sp. (in: a-proteobacteria)]
MVGLGLLFIAATGYFFIISSFRRGRYPKWALRGAVMMIPLPWVAAELGWIVAEYGRQPWTVDGILPTALSVSALSATEVLLTIAGFADFYTLLFVIEVRLLLKYIRLGPQEDVQITDDWRASHRARLKPAE